MGCVLPTKGPLLLWAQAHRSRKPASAVLSIGEFRKFHETFFPYIPRKKGGMQASQARMLIHAQHIASNHLLVELPRPHFRQLLGDQGALGGIT